MKREVQLKDCDIVTAYDPARTRESEYGRLARNAVMTTACDSDYNVYVLKPWAQRTSFDKVYEEVVQQVELFNPRCIGVEDVATQIAIADAFVLLSQRDGIYLPPIESLRPDTRVVKKWRIKTIIQRYGPYNKLFCQEDEYEFKSEFGAFPTGRTIDLLDVFAYCLTMHNIPDDIFLRSYNDSVRMRRNESLGGKLYDIDEEREKRYVMPGPPEGVRKVLHYV